MDLILFINIVYMNRINNFDIIKNLQIIDFSLNEIYKNVDNFNPSVKNNYGFNNCNSNTPHGNKISPLEHHLEGGYKQQKKYNHFPVNYSENYDTETSQTNFNVINYLSLGKNLTSSHTNNTKKNESSIFIKQSHKTPTAKRTRKYKKESKKQTKKRTNKRKSKRSKKESKKQTKKKTSKRTNKRSKK